MKKGFLEANPEVAESVLLKALSSHSDCFLSLTHRYWRADRLVRDRWRDAAEVEDSGTVSMSCSRGKSHFANDAIQGRICDSVQAMQPTRGMAIYYTSPTSATSHFALHHRTG